MYGIVHQHVSQVLVSETKISEGENLHSCQVTCTSFSNIINHSDKGLMLKTSAFNLFKVVNLHFQLSC